MAKKKTKKKTYTITVCCAKCSAALYRYKKEGGGTLIKCYADMIMENHTKGDLKCPSCEQEFARHAIIHNRPAHKIIRGKVFVKGHHG